MSEPESPAPERDTPRGEVLGIDEQQTWNQWREKHVAYLDSDESKASAVRAARDQDRTITDTLYMRVVRRHIGKRVWFNAECIAGLPAERTSIRLTLDKTEWVASEAKHALAQLLFRTRLCGTWDAAQQRAARANIVIADEVNAQ